MARGEASCVGDENKLVGTSVAAGRLDVRQLALADKPGIMTFHAFEGRAGDTSSLALSAVGGQRGTETNVTVTTLDELVGDAPCAAIKLDIQGYEMEALRGAASLLAR